MASSPWYGRALPFAGGLAALVPALVMWGFTVDDALIPLRYAHHLAAGVGYRFSTRGPVTDGVTPLPWAPLLTTLATGDLVVALERVKVLGVAAWTAAGVVLGHALARRSRGDARARTHAAAALLVVALAFPIGAWAASGMETGAATALASLAAASFDRPRRAAALGGLAACLRPELVVWAVVLAAGAALGREAPGPCRARAAARVALVAGLAAVPFAACAIARLVVFGRPAPLAVLAKPSDLHHGLAYAGAAFVASLTPLLACAPLALRRASALGKTLVLALGAHVLVVVAVGGDWMPYARLMVPVAPSIAIAFVELGRVAHPAASAARALAALAAGALLAATAAPLGRGVHRDRKELIARARPVLASSEVVASLDVGWVGAASHADVVDLAGLTDPAIAVLPGGHTSKLVDTSMLLERGVDTVVVYGEPRLVERRLLRSALFHERFAAAEELPLGHAGRYTVFRRR